MYKKYLLILLSLIFFIIGNIVYSSVIDIPWYIRSIISELMFVIMYTTIDYGNLKYRYSFAIPHMFLLLIFYLPFFLPLFYNVNAQYFSVSIAILAIAINSRILYFLYNKGFTKILCTRASTAIASIVEIILFSSILHLGAKGAILMMILRPIYIAIIPKFVFKK
ncbi:hypothetical protein ACFX5K_01820 [Rickettsiales bacterium LUAb2]